MACADSCLGIVTKRGTDTHSEVAKALLNSFHVFLGLPVQVDALIDQVMSGSLPTLK